MYHIQLRPILLYIMLLGKTRINDRVTSTNPFNPIPNPNPSSNPYSNFDSNHNSISPIEVSEQRQTLTLNLSLTITLTPTCYTQLGNRHCRAVASSQQKEDFSTLSSRLPTEGRYPGKKFYLFVYVCKTIMAARLI
jgi:hypothetical protein